MDKNKTYRCRKKGKLFLSDSTIIDFILFDILEYIYIYIHLDIVN